MNIDSDNIESIKIIKGGASYLYGNDALAGAIIITTKRPKGKNEGFVTIESGSDGYEKYVANYMGSTENFAYEVQGSYKASDGWWDESDYWAKSFNGKFQYYIDDSSDITFGADKSTRYENDTGSLTHTVDGVNQVETNPKSYGEVGFNKDFDIDLSKYFMTYSKDFANDANLMTQVYRYEDTTESLNRAYDGIPDNGLLRDDHLSDSYANTIQNGIKSEYRQDGDQLAYMVGLDLARNEEDRTSTDRVTTRWKGTQYTLGNVRSDTSFTEDIAALYGELKYKVTDKLIATVNSRYDHLKYDFTNNLTSDSWDKNFDEMSYRVGATYKIEEDSIVYTSMSTGFRVPTIAQLYAGTLATSTYNGTYSDNPDIETEKTYNYELGYRGKNDLFTYEVAVYQLDRKDVIGRSSGNYASARGVELEYDNMSDVRNRGLELSLYSDKSKQFYYAFNYTYLDAKYTRYDEYNLILNEAGVDLNGNFERDGVTPKTDDDYVAGVYDLSGNTVPRTSKHTVYLEGNYKATSNWLLTAGLNYRSSQYADDMNQIKLDGYSLLDLRTTYNTNIFGLDVEFFAKVDNVFDEQYFMMPRVTGDRNDDGEYNIGDMGLTVNPGRTYLMGLSAKF